MMHYALRCAAGHTFDGWFASSDAFERQRKADLLACPHCGSAEVERALMAPAIGGTARGEPAEERAEAPPTGNEGGESRPVALVDEPSQKLRALLRAMHTMVKESGVDVGRNFPEEARRIHYGETEQRGIYGQANLEEARALVEEGIDILPLPALPDERN